MSIITDLNLFTGPINIDTSSIGVQSEIQTYCETIEADALESLLGRTLYTEYLEDDTVEKFDQLINGYDTAFEYNGITRKYNGLKEKFCYLIYFKYLQDQYASNTSYGDVQPTPGSGTFTVNIPRLVRAYNKWVDAFNDAVDFINYKNSLVQDTFEDFDTEKIEYMNTFGI